MMQDVLIQEKYRSPHITLNIKWLCSHLVISIEQANVLCEWFENFNEIVKEAEEKEEKRLLKHKEAYKVASLFFVKNL